MIIIVVVFTFTFGNQFPQESTEGLKFSSPIVATGTSQSLKLIERGGLDVVNAANEMVMIVCRWL